MPPGLFFVPSRRQPRRRHALMLGASIGAISFASTADAAGPAPFSAAWFAAKGAAGPAASAAIANAAAGAGMSSASYAQVRRSLANLQHTAAAIAAMRAAQAQARSLGAGLANPDGLQAGGLVPDAGLAAPGLAKPVTSWTGALAPVQTGPAAAPTVTIRQTAASAVLNWTTLNVGPHTTLAFDQSGGGAAAPTWVALNRVSDPAGAPAQIAGRITAQGHVVIIDNSGILFTPTAQVTVGSLIASTASITDTQFAANGIYGPNGVPSFTGAAAPVTVQAGAQLATTTPISVTDAGGGVILLGSSVTNAGSIDTPAGQTILAAGRDFAPQQGYSVAQIPAGASQTAFDEPSAIAGNVYRTTRGTEIAVTAGGGPALNSGIIEADQGDITIVGETVTQAGVAASTTTTATRGTIHLLTDQTDAQSSVTLAPGSVTTILPDPASPTALDAQRATDVSDSLSADLIRAQGTGTTFLNDQPQQIPDNQYQSLIQIVSGNTVDAGAGSLALSEGGQIQIVAPGRVLVETGAELDVSGAVGVSLPMLANQVTVNVQGFELRDNPLNRDTKQLNNGTVYLDVRNLVTVASNPASVDSPYDTGTTPARQYTEGGLLEVSGEVSNIGHTIGEWSAPGGTILISGGSAGQVVAQPGSVFNLAGGSIDYRAGPLKLTWLIGPDGLLYNARTAPAELVYTGIYDGVSETHARWNITDTYNNPLIAPTTENLPGYVAGRDGGTLEISEPTAVLEATIDAGVIDGPTQTAARNATPNLDPYLQPQTAVPLPGQLLIGRYNGQGYGGLGLVGGYQTTVGFQAGGAPIAASLALATPLPAGRLDTAILDSDALDGLGAIGVTTEGVATVVSPLVLADAGRLALHAAGVLVDAPVTAHGGDVSLGDVVPALDPTTAEPDQSLVPTTATETGATIPTANAAVIVAAGVTIDLTGRWTNTALDPVDLAGEAAIGGGSLTIDTTGALTLAPGSTVDASAGAVLSRTGTLTSGIGGSVSLTGDDPNGNPVYDATTETSTLPVSLAGTIRSIGAVGQTGGTLTLQAPGVLIESVPPTGLAADGRTILAPSRFDAGFTTYSIDGYGNLPTVPGKTVLAPFTAATAPAIPLPGVEVAAGTAVAPLVPVYLLAASSLLAPTGTAPEAAVTTGLPPLYAQNQTAATLARRTGASLELYSRNRNLLVGPELPLDGGGGVTVDAGASLSVDPAQRASIEAIGQITIEGDITAPGGTISIQNDTYEPSANAIALGYNPDLSIWIGSGAVLDASAVAQTATDLFGRPYGVAPGGGQVSIGGSSTTPDYPGSTDAYVVIRPGAVVEASGTTTAVDLSAGQGANATPDQVTLAGSGGSILLDSTSGVAIDGTVQAPAGGPNAAGGSLEVDLVTPSYTEQSVSGATDLPFVLPDALHIQRTIVVAQRTGQALPNDLQPGQSLAPLLGLAYLSADQVSAGGFASLTLAGNMFAGHGPTSVMFDGPVSLSASSSIDLPAQLTEANTNTTVRIAAPLVTLNANAVIDQFTRSGPGIEQSALTFNETPSSVFSPSQTATASTLTIDSDQLIVGTGDIGGLRVTSTLNTPSGGTVSPTAIADEPGFAATAFSSEGDTQLDGILAAAGNLSITAAQVYPIAASTITLDVDQNGPARNAAQPGTLTFARTPGTNPAAPLQVGQSVVLSAGKIEQGGILRAPLGAIGIGFASTQPFQPQPGSTGYTDQIEFLPGSLTSTSAAGQIVLYGGTADGVTYNAAAAAITTGDGLVPSIDLRAQSVLLDAGATLDLSGGGTLAGAAFNSGRGGSTDVLTAPLIQFSGTTATQPADQVYSIIPGYAGTTQQSPVTAVEYASGIDAAPPTGERITVGAGVPGLAAGTYTLQPAYDALLPGAYRVELQPTVTPITSVAAAVGNLSTQAAVTVGIAGTAVRGPTPIGALFTSGADVRRLSSYDEETVSAFVLGQAALLGTPRGTLPADAGSLVLDYSNPVATRSLPGPPLSVQGTALFAPAPGGYGGFVDVQASAGTGGSNAIDIVGDAAADPVAVAGAGTATDANGTPVSLRASDLDRLAPETLSIGGAETLPSSQTQATSFGLYILNAATSSVVVDAGATLSAPQVFLVAGSAVSVAAGGTVDTLGRGATSTDSATDGFVYTDVNGSSASTVVAISNGLLTFAPPGPAAGTVNIASGATLVGDGTVAIDTAGAVTVGDQAVFAARDLSFAVSSVNVVPASGLPAGAVAPAGLDLSQALLSRLAAGGIVPGAPALQQLDLLATGSVDFFGTVGFQLGGSQTLILDTPSIYGVGQPTDVATVTAGTFIWNGLAATANAGQVVGVAGADTDVVTYAGRAAAPIMNDGPGTGSGSLVVDAADIVLGYAPGQQVLTPAPAGGAPVLGRTAYGFAAVDLDATRSVTANSSGTLAVYQSQGAYANGGYANTGGALTISTPLLTTAAGAILQADAGGPIAVTSPGGAAGAAAGLGGEIDLTGSAITIGSTVALPEGKLSLTAGGDIAITAGAAIDLAGVSNVFFDQTVAGPGGTLVAGSSAGSFTADRASTIDVSSPGGAAGSIEITAIDAAGQAGNVSLAGAIEGGGSGQGGVIGIRATTLADFAGLNQRLTAGGLDGGRTVEIGTGDLTIETADQVRAAAVNLTLDSGNLTVDGLVDASGPAPGNISLSAGGDLTLTASAVLDAHGTVLQTDSLGQPIDAENNGTVTLRVADGPNGANHIAGAGGTLTITPGATIDVASAPYPTGMTCAACGDVEIDVPRIGSATSADLAISAPAGITITGAQTVAVNGFWTYTPTNADGLVAQTQVAADADPTGTGIGLDQVDADDRAFIASAIPNGALNPTLAASLAGLAGEAFHLRPGVEIDSSAASGGDLTVVGDLDLSGLRYASLNTSSQLTAAYGSGEPGVLVLRASNNLNVYGSVTDGFEEPVDTVGAANPAASPPPNPDDNGWILQDSNLTGAGTDQAIVVPFGADPVDIGGSTFNNTTQTVNYAVPVASQTLAVGTVLPTSISLPAPVAVAAAVVAGGDVIGPDGKTVLYGKGSTIPAGTVLPQGASLDAGFELFANTRFAATNALTGTAQTWPADTSFAPFGASVQLAATAMLQPGDVIPVDTGLTLNNTPSVSDQINLRQPTILANGNAYQGSVYAASNLLPAGSLSWSVALVAGGNTASADPTALTPAGSLAAGGNLTLSDLHEAAIVTNGPFGPATAYIPAFSVVRTGTGSLGLFAGGALDEASTYGIYTAGAQSPGIDAAFDQHVPAASLVDPDIEATAETAVYEAVDAAYPQGGGNVSILSQGPLQTTSLPEFGLSALTAYTSQTGAWLERQGDGSAADPGAWSINFGTYLPVTAIDPGTTSSDILPLLVGFTGFGTLGGGNLAVVSGADAGTSSQQAGPPEIQTNDTNGDAVSAYHNTSLDLVVGSTGRETATGLVLTGGGSLSLGVAGTLDPVSNNLAAVTAPISAQSSIVSLRGSVSVTAGAVGAVNAQTGRATPLDNPYTAAIANGPELILGDAGASITARGDISLGEAGDAAREPTLDVSPNGAISWFSLWQPTTAIGLYSAGGNISPGIVNQPVTYDPPTLDVVAASGDIYTLSTGAKNDVLETAPSPTGQLRYLAGGSIVSGLGSQAGGITDDTIVAMSGADPTLLPTVANPAFTGETGTAAPDNTTAAADALFAFGTDTPTGYLHAADPNPIRFYAATGDIENLSTGEIVTGIATPQYLAAKPVRIEAGDDIVDLDPAMNSGLLWNNTANDVSEISAGNDIFYAEADVSGPGLLEVSAGNNIDQTETAGTSFSLTSLGYLVDKTVATQNSGAGITVSAGATPRTLDLTAFADLYFNLANLANPLIPLQDQPGKVERTYQSELLAFLQQRTGYAGGQSGALAAFAALPPDIQQILVLQTYYAELNQSGLDDSNPASRFYKSFSEGTEAIGTLLPATDLSGQTAAAGGSLTLTGGSGITTEFGGTIQILDPAGATTVGVPGMVPPSTAGVITQGSGDVDIYSYGSVLLGQSRIFTTFGGNITIWLQGGGEINGGQGSASTIVFTPPVIAYDAIGDVSLSPTTPSTGAGIATLAPVAGIPPGDINLVSPFGTIDAGEAGIRSSGNVNLVALTILNAANVQAGGHVTGVSVAAVPNVAAITAASAAAGSATNAAQNNLRPVSAQKTPSIITVDVVGGGNNAAGDDDTKRKHKS